MARENTRCLAWSLVTAPDERERCCVIEAGQRCPRETAVRIAAVTGELDDYTYTCTVHAV